MPSPLEIKERQREGYDETAERFDAVWARYSARFGVDLIDLVFPQQGEAALDLAGGTGAAGLKLADRVGRDGHVTIVDLSPRMLEVAARNAAGRGLSSVTTRVMDAEKLELADGSFDLVVCTFGVMFFPDVRRALAEAWRVLRPGGRIGFTVWSVPERIPFFTAMAEAALREMAPAGVGFLIDLPLIGRRIRDRILSAPTPRGPSPCRFARAGSLERELARAGFGSIRRELRAYPLEFASFDEYWDALTRGTPAIALTRQLPPSKLEAVKRAARAKLATGRAGNLLMYNEAALVLAHKNGAGSAPRRG